MEENVATVKFYRNMSLIATAVQFLGFAVYAELSTLAVVWLDYGYSLITRHVTSTLTHCRS